MKVFPNKKEYSNIKFSCFLRNLIVPKKRNEKKIIIREK